MLRVSAARLRQGYRTIPYPKGDAVLPDRFRGRPSVDFSKCPPDCRTCREACPTGAVSPAGPIPGFPSPGTHAVKESVLRDPALSAWLQVPAAGLGDRKTPLGGDSIRCDAGKGALDMGRCLFCADCAKACPQGAIRFTQEHQLAAWSREDLVVRNPQPEPKGPPDDSRRKIFRLSLAFRQVSAGGCGACEADINVLNTVVFDLGRFGISIVASPRHADGLLITGPVTENMKSALEKTYKALPPPRLVVAVGACAISGGPFAGHPEVHNGAGGVVPVDLCIPGCPPHPLTILDGLLRIVGKQK